jgi:hypothetical protein
MEVIRLQGDIKTNLYGHNTLLDFYSKAKRFNNEEILIDFYNLNWIDANLCAFFAAILFHLSNKNNLKFVADSDFLEKNFEVLYRNGFLQKSSDVIDNRRSTIPFGKFSSSDKEFIIYLLGDLLPHRALKKIPPYQKERIKDDLTELYTNVNLHSKTEDPFFVCGQLFTSKNYSIFSIVDLGIGFLPAIKEKTKGAIQTDVDAIKWALKNGNSTRKQIEGVTTEVGGIGLSRILEFCETNKGRLQIISGNCFFDANYLGGVESGFQIGHFDASLCTIVNLFFKYE